MKIIKAAVQMTQSINKVSYILCIIVLFLIFFFKFWLIISSYDVSVPTKPHTAKKRERAGGTH